MKKLGLGLLMILLLNVFASCDDTNSELTEMAPVDQQMSGGGEEDEDDPIVSGDQ